jgi:HEAT repeats
MKNSILAGVLLLIIVTAVGGSAFYAWSTWWNIPVREEKRDQILFEGKTLHQWTNELNSENPSVRDAAFEALMKVPPKDGQFMLGGAVDALKNQKGDKLNRCHAGAVIANVITRVGIPGPMGQVVAPPLVELLGDEDPNIRREAAKVLESFGPMVRESGSALEEHAKSDPDEEAREASARALDKVYARSRASKSESKDKGGASGKPNASGKSNP